MVNIEYETPARVALSVAREATTESSGKDILKKYRELVARKSSEKLLSKENKNASSCPNFNRNVIKPGDGNETTLSEKKTRDFKLSGKQSQFSIHEDNTSDSCQKSKKESINLMKHLMKEGTNRIALKSRSINIPLENIRKDKSNTIDSLKKTPVTIAKKKPHSYSHELPSSTLSPINVESPLQHVSHATSSPKNYEETSPDINKIGEEPSVTNEDSPQNFSTIEKNESIWFMAEGGSSPEITANFENEYNDNEKYEELASNNAYTSDDIHSEPQRTTNNQQEASYCENGEKINAQCNTMGNSIQTFSVDSRSFSNKSCARNFSSPTTPKHNVSVAISESSASETVSGVTIFPTENYKWEQSEGQSSEVSQDYRWSMKKYDKCLSNEVQVENPDCFVSPASKAIAVGFVGSSQTQNNSPEIFKLATASLIERNKTLVKEVRFVDQNCVELSERNASLRRDIQRLEENIKDLKIENESLHEAVVRSSHHSAKMEMSREAAELKMSEKKEHFLELKNQVESLTQKLEKSQDEKKVVEMELASSIGKYEILLSKNTEARDNNEGLIERLVASQSTSELATASAESFREFRNIMEKKVEELQNLADERLNTLMKEQHERKIIEEKLVKFKEKASEIDNNDYEAEKVGQFTNDIVTPQKYMTDSITNTRTPTSTVLARTLQSELRRAHDVADRVVEAEKIISITQTKLKAVTQELLSSKEDTKHLHALLKNCKCGRALFKNRMELNDFTHIHTDLVNESFHPHSSLVKCITQTRSECEKKKRDFNSVMEKIAKMEMKESPHCVNEQTIRLNLLHALQKMANVCTALSDNISDNEAILHSEHLFDEHASISLNGEEQFQNPRSSTSNILTSLETTCTPSEIVLNSKSNEPISPVTAIKLSSSINLSSMKTNTPLKITQFREDILKLQSQLDTANNEKNAISIALNHACYELKNMTKIAKLDDLDKANTSKSTQGYQQVVSDESNNQITFDEHEPRQQFGWQELSRQEIVCLNNEVVHLQEKMREGNEDTHVLKEKLKQLQHSKDLLEAKTTNLEKELEAAQKEINRLGEEEQSNEGGNGIDSKEVTEQLDKLKVSFVLSQERLVEEVERNYQLKKVEKDLKNKVCSLMESLEETSSKLAEANKDIQITSNKLTESYYTDNNSKQEYQNLQEELAELKKLCADYKDECSSKKHLEDELKKLKDEAKLASKEKQEIDRLLNLRIKDIEQLKSERESLTKSWEAERKGHCDLMRKLQIDIEHKTQELEFINAKLDEDLQIQTKIACSASEEIKHLKSNYTIASEHACKLEEECSELKLKLESVDRKSNKKREYIKKLTKRCEEWKAFYQQQVKDFCETENKYEDAKFKILDLTEEVHALREECFKNESDNAKSSGGDSDEIINKSISETCNECKYLRKAISKESSALSILKKQVGEKDNQIESLTLELKKLNVQSSDSPLS